MACLFAGVLLYVMLAGCLPVDEPEPPLLLARRSGAVRHAGRLPAIRRARAASALRAHQDRRLLDATLAERAGGGRAAPHAAAGSRGQVRRRSAAAPEPHRSGAGCRALRQRPRTPGRSWGVPPSGRLAAAASPAPAPTPPLECHRPTPEQLFEDPWMRPAPGPAGRPTSARPSVQLVARLAEGSPDLFRETVVVERVRVWAAARLDAHWLHRSRLAPPAGLEERAPGCPNLHPRRRGALAFAPFSPPHVPPSNPPCAHRPCWSGARRCPRAPAGSAPSSS